MGKSGREFIQQDSGKEAHPNCGFQVEPATARRGFSLVRRERGPQVLRPEFRAHKFMPDPTDLKQRIKLMLVDNLMLQVSAAELGDDTPLFGPEGLGLDSVDALQLVVALEKNFRLKIADTGEAKKILRSVNTIAAAVLLAENNRKQPPLD